MKKLYIIFALSLGLQMSTSIAQNITDKIRSFFKKNEVKIGVVAATLAGTGMGSYITYCLCTRNMSMKKSVDKQVQNAREDRGTQHVETNTQAENYKKRLAQMFKNEFEKFFRQQCSAVAKAAGKWEIAEIVIYDDGFRIHLKGTNNVFTVDSPQWYIHSIDEWPLWKYQDNDQLESLVFSGYDGTFSRGFRFHKYKYTINNGKWENVLRD